MVLWRLTSQSFCKGTYKVYNLQLFAGNLTLFRNVFYSYIWFKETPKSFASGRN